MKSLLKWAGVVVWISFVINGCSGNSDNGGNNVRFTESLVKEKVVYSYENDRSGAALDLKSVSGTTGVVRRTTFTKDHHVLIEEDPSSRQARNCTPVWEVKNGVLIVDGCGIDTRYELLNSDPKGWLVMDLNTSTQQEWYIQQKFTVDTLEEKTIYQSSKDPDKRYEIYYGWIDGSTIKGEFYLLDSNGDVNKTLNFNINENGGFEVLNENLEEEATFYLIGESEKNGAQYLDIWGEKTQQTSDILEGADRWIGTKK